MSLQNNNLTSTVPVEWGVLVNVQVYLGRNALIGDVPDGLCGLLELCAEYNSVQCNCCTHLVTTLVLRSELQLDNTFTVLAITLHIPLHITKYLFLGASI